MADISKVKLNGITYTIKDETARANLGISQTNADNRYLKLSGGTMAGTLSLNNHKITAVATPTGNADAANKAYVDNSIPTALKNPNSIRFTGASVATYDGSSAVTVNIPVIPTSLKNPYKLSFTGAVNTTYDGSAAVSVAITQVKLKSWTAADFT